MLSKRYKKLPKKTKDSDIKHYQELLKKMIDRSINIGKKKFD